MPLKSSTKKMTSSSVRSSMFSKPTCALYIYYQGFENISVKVNTGNTLQNNVWCEPWTNDKHTIKTLKLEVLEYVELRPQKYSEFKINLRIAKGRREKLRKCMKKNQ